METKSHWESIYKNKKTGEVSWHQPHLEKSLALIREMRVDKKACIIDVGGGASTLVGDLLLEGYKDLTIVDISSEALCKSQDRLKEKAGRVTWIEADILKINFPKNSFDLWHDRAVFHFLTSSADRRKYLRLLNEALKPKGLLIIATFSLEGPKRCSGLNVVRYDSTKLQAELGKNFEFVDSMPENHITPFGTVQKFIYCCFRKNDNNSKKWNLKMKKKF